MFDKSVAATPEGLIVEPYCVERVGGVHGFVVVSPSISVAGSPALVHVIARDVARIFDQDCAPDAADNTRIHKTARIFFIVEPSSH